MPFEPALLPPPEPLRLSDLVPTEIIILSWKRCTREHVLSNALSSPDESPETIVAAAYAACRVEWRAVRARVAGTVKDPQIVADTLARFQVIRDGDLLSLVHVVRVDQARRLIKPDEEA
jgi:hypothetical protein